ncbi:hypothetical protein [Sphingomonas sp. MS122]|uniref:hypothetical protein n=1 Tax=Sphingomonas sp. MS122 TaxID=3412683 RepID=UPI003C2BC938
MLLSAIVASALCPPALASGADLPIIAAAIRAGRLIQAEVMLARLPAPADAVEAEAVDAIRGQFALATGASAQALQIFGRLREVAPARCDYLRDFGVAAARLGDARALEALRDTAPRCATWQSSQMLGVVLARGQGWAESESAFAQSLSLSPDNPVTLNNRAFARIEQGRYADARDDLGKALRAAPGDRRIAGNIDLVEGAMGNAPRRRGGVDDDRRWASRLTLASKGALRAGRRDLARALLAEAIQIDPQFTPEANRLLDGLKDARGEAR